MNVMNMLKAENYDKFDFVPIYKCFKAAHDLSGPFDRGSLDTHVE